MSTTEAPETLNSGHRALGQLLQRVESLVADFSADINKALAPLVSAALQENSGDIWFSGVIESFGWEEDHFSRVVDVRALCSKLKALIFDGLQEKGRGAYATVYKARNILTGEVITLKKLKLDREEEGVPGTAIREVSLLRELQHPNIVTLKDVLWEHNRLYLIMEYLDLDLRQHMDSTPEASHPDNVRLYMYQILQGIQHTHAHLIIHRDLKPQNILVDRSTNTLKLADFGLARCFTPPVRAYTHEVVTLLYRAPEILLGLQCYSTPVDIWSAGCIFAELVNGQAAFPGDSEIGQLYKIFQVLGTPDESDWPGVTSLPDWQPMFPRWAPKGLHQLCPTLDALGLDLLRQMLTYQPEQRITARQALEHPYFRGLTPAHSPGTPSPQNGRPITGGPSTSDTEQGLRASSLSREADLHPAPSRSTSPGQMSSPEVNTGQRAPRSEEMQPAPVHRMQTRSQSGGRAPVGAVSADQPSADAADVEMHDSPDSAAVRPWGENQQAQPMSGIQRGKRG